MDKKFEIIEPGGSGGVYQHSVALAAQIEELFERVTIHTSKSPETFNEGAFQICECFNWFRSDKKFKRRVKFSLYFTFRTWPHLIWHARKSFVNLQGISIPIMSLIIVTGFRILRHKVVFTPHNLFARDKGKIAQVILKACTRFSNLIITFSKSDTKYLIGKGVECFSAPLFMPRNPLDPGRVELWEKRVRKSGKITLLLAGQLRLDKGLRDLEELMLNLEEKYTLAVVGKSTTSEAGEILNKLQSQDNIIVIDEYLDFADFYTLISVSDYVLLPYKLASQSGIIELASSLNVPTISYPVGALGERATYVTEYGNPQSMAKTITTLGTPKEAVVKEEDEKNDFWMEEFRNRLSRL
jgi:glycosyltransferase involved in cell wall biosynthesis